MAGASTKYSAYPNRFRCLKVTKSKDRLILDHFYLSKTLLGIIREYNQTHKEKLDVLIRVKKNFMDSSSNRSYEKERERKIQKESILFLKPS